MTEYVCVNLTECSTKTKLEKKDKGGAERERIVIESCLKPRWIQLFKAHLCLQWEPPLQVRGRAMTIIIQKHIKLTKDLYQ